MKQPKEWPPYNFPETDFPKISVCPRCGEFGYHNCTKMAGQKSPFGPELMVDNSLGWPYTDPNIKYDC